MNERTPAATLPPEVDLALVARLRVAVARLNRQLRQQSGGLSPTLQSALVTIEKHGPLTLGDVAAREQVAPATVTKLVTKLVEQGLVDRRTDPDDGRVVRVALTEAGAEQLAESRSRRNAFLANRLAEPGAPTIDAVRTAADVLEQLSASLDVPRQPPTDQESPR